MDNSLDLPIQLISEDGKLNDDGLEQFIEMLKYNGPSYAVISIVGPQSSGKSTLLNELFGTNFVEMDADKGRSAITKGVWLAKASGVEPLTIVMDLEGTDGRERGEDDTTFEKWIAFFSLALSDTLLINMWCHDVGRVQAANQPLLRIMFQVLKSKQFSGSDKKTLMFLVRDNTSPVESLESLLINDIHKIWDNVPDPSTDQKTLNEFFNVEVVALSHYIFQKKEFREEVESLKQRCGYTRGHRRWIPLSGFRSSCQETWKSIRENKDLDLPAHKDLVADKRCEDIADDEYSSFKASQEWLELKEMEQSESEDSGKAQKLFAMIETYMERYEQETIYFHEPFKSGRKEQLGEKLFQLIKPTLDNILRGVNTSIFEALKEKLEVAVKGGQDLDSAAADCTKWFINEFWKRLEDAGFKPQDPLGISEMQQLERDVHELLRAVDLGRSVGIKESTKIFQQLLLMVAFGAALCCAIPGNLVPTLGKKAPLAVILRILSTALSAKLH